MRSLFLLPAYGTELIGEPSTLTLRQACFRIGQTLVDYRKLLFGVALLPHDTLTTDTNTRWRIPKRPNEPAHLPGPLGELHISKSLHAGRVRCSAGSAQCYCLPSTKSTTQQPRTCGPGPRQ